jgi:hypothetical protein
MQNMWPRDRNDKTTPEKNFYCKFEDEFIASFFLLIVLFREQAQQRIQETVGFGPSKRPKEMPLLVTRPHTSRT